jgi:hypothetical protein
MRFLPVALALPALLGALLSTTLGGCAAPEAETEAAEADESDLTLASADVVGTLDGRASAEAAVPAGTKYRALSFTATANTRVGISVSSHDGVPTALLLGPTFQTIAKKKARAAVDAPNRLEAMVTMTFDVPAAGTYYVAFRDLGGAAATFEAARIGTIPGAATCTKNAECTGVKNTCALGRCVETRTSTTSFASESFSLGYDGKVLSLASLTRLPEPIHGSFPARWSLQSGPIEAAQRPTVTAVGSRPNGSGYAPTMFAFERTPTGRAVLATTDTSFHATTLSFGTDLVSTPPPQQLAVPGDINYAFDAVRRADGTDLAAVYNCNPVGSSQPAQCVLYLAKRATEQSVWTVETVSREAGPNRTIGSVLVHPRADGDVEILAGGQSGIQGFRKGPSGWRSFPVYSQAGFNMESRFDHGVEGRSHVAVGETRLDSSGRVLRFESHYLEIGDSGQIIRRFPLETQYGDATRYSAPRPDGQGNVYLIEGESPTALVRIDGAGAVTRRAITVSPTALRTWSLAVGVDGAVAFGAVHSIQGGTFYELGVQRFEP